MFIFVCLQKQMTVTLKRFHFNRSWMHFNKCPTLSHFILSIRNVKSSRPTRFQGQIFGLGLVVSGFGLVLGLVQRWPRSHLGWPRGLVVNHQNLVVNESQLSVTQYLSASSSEYWLPSFSYGCAAWMVCLWVGVWVCPHMLLLLENEGLNQKSEWTT